MATKLDLAIAKLAIAIAPWNRRDMMAAGAHVAAGVSSADLAKLPDRWAPRVSAKTAGVPELGDSWHRLWFEAVVKILVQKKHEGVPGLLILWERDEASYQDLVLIRLLRLAADDVDRDEILARVRARFATLHYVACHTAVREVVDWAAEDRRPLELLEQMSDVVVPRSDGDTIGTYIGRFQWEAGIREAREATP